MSLLHCCGGILAYSSLNNSFNSPSLEGFWAWVARLRFFHSISMRFKSSIWFCHSKTSLLLLLSHSEVNLLVCFTSLSSCITQLPLIYSIRSLINNDKSFRYCRKKAVPDHHTTTTTFDRRYVVLMVECSVSSTPDVTGPMFPKSYTFTHQSTEYYATSLGGCPKKYLCSF